jgi:hypothetical protein
LGHPPSVGGHLEGFPGVLAREELRNLDQIPLSSPPNSRGFHTRSLLVFFAQLRPFLAVVFVVVVAFVVAFVVYIVVLVSPSFF